MSDSKSVWFFSNMGLGVYLLMSICMGALLGPMFWGLLVRSFGITSTSLLVFIVGISAFVAPIGLAGLLGWIFGEEFVSGVLSLG